MWAENYRAVAEVTLPILKSYCMKHGYNLVELKLEDENYGFKKHELFKKLLETKTDAIFYIDIDAVITNQQIPIEFFMDKEHDFFITEDVNELNGGVLILKNTDWAKQFNNIVLEKRAEYGNEQNVYVALKESIKDKMKILPHPSINSYDYSLYQEFPNLRERERGHWHSGDFILHVPALHPDKKLEVIKKAIA